MAGVLLLTDIFVGSLVLYILKHLLSSRSSVKKQSSLLPPGPKGLPLIGNLLDLPPPGEQEWIHWRKHKSLYGPVSSITVLGQTIIILNDYQAAVDLLEKKSGIHSDRPALPFGGEMVGWQTSLPMSHYGDRFRQYRRHFHQFLGTKSAVARFQPLEFVETRRFLLRVMRDPSSLVEQIRRTAGAIILKLSHGYTIEPEGPDPLVDLADEVLLEFALSTQPGLWMVDVLPFLRYLPDWFPGTAFKRVAARWRAHSKEFVEKPHAFVQHQLNEAAMSGHPIAADPSFVFSPDAHPYDTVANSYVGSLLQKAETPDDHSAIKWGAAGVYGGGADTTVSAIASFYLAMSLHPEVQKRAQEEIDRVVGTDRLPTFEDREKLPYVEALYLETLRWNPVAPLGLPHVPIEDSMYQGHLIPKGAILMANCWEFGHNTESYVDPASFKPERFIGIDGRAPEDDPRNYCFGFGRRICPGKDLADATVWMSVAMSLAVFNIGSLHDDVGKSKEQFVEYTPGIISHPKNVKCSIVPRSENAAALIRSVEEEHPYEKSDSETLAHVKWDASNV